MTNLVSQGDFMSIFIAAALAVAAFPEVPRIEDIRQDLTKSEIDTAQAARTEALSTEAYLWGIPAFLHFRQATEIKQSRKYFSPDEEPFGGWVLIRKLSTPETDNALPNVDTLYGANYVHLGKQGPVILEIPAIADRYFSVAILDAYFNNFEILGTRNMEGKAGRFLIVPPGWQGTAPEGVERVIQAPTSMISLYQRIYVSDETEFEKVGKLQDQIRVRPMAGGAFPKIDTPEFDVKQPVRQTRDPLRYFEIVNSYTGINPPSQQYAAMMASFADVGIGPNAKLPTEPLLSEAIRSGARKAQAVIDADITQGPFRDGWKVPDPRGARPGPYTLAQAVIQLSQIGSLPMDEAVYYVGRRDNSGELLSGRNNYQLTFKSGQLPPIDARGFWSVTMYKASDLLLVDNSINRYVIRPTTPGLKKNRDGSLTIHISNLKPKSVPEGNWLPSPADGFVLAIRAYMPTGDIIDGKWFPPAPEKTPAKK
jgi:hypothetical protein